MKSVGPGPVFLCIAPPPASPVAPPAGPAYLLGYLRSKGCRDFGFLDLRLGVPDAHSPSWTYSGAFGESFVMDIPDLPLVLELITANDDGSAFFSTHSCLFRRYCVERAIPPDYLHSYLLGLDRYFAAVFAQLPEIRFVGFTVWTTNFLATLLAAAHLKRLPNPPVLVAGGPQVTSSTASADLALRSRLFDIVVLGEGEATLHEIYNSFSRTGAVPRGIPGTAALDDACAVTRIERPLLRLPELPTPSFAEMNIEAYQCTPGQRVLPLQFSRGCTEKCSFCSEWKFWKRFRPDTVDHVVDQVEEFRGRYRADFILFVDSLLNGVPQRLANFARSLCARRIDLDWSSFMRAKMDTDTASLLRKSGCYDVFVGVDSMSDETLDLMRKRRTEADNIRALHTFLRAGIDVTAGLIPGFPGDSREAFLHTISVVRDVQRQYPGRLEIQIEPFFVQSGAPIMERLEDVGLKGQCWDDEYVDIALAYADITSKVLCHVEGNNQGIERLGRLSITRTLEADLTTNSVFTFMRASEEALSVCEFEFIAIKSGWHCAQKRSDAGHVFALIVDDGEKEELTLLQDEISLEGLPTRRVRSTLSRLRSKQLIPPRPNGPLVIQPLETIDVPSRCRYAISPYIVARVARRCGIILFNVANQREYFKPRRYAAILSALRRGAAIPATIERRLAAAGHAFPRRGLQSALGDLVEYGIVVRCGSSR